MPLIGNAMGVIEAVAEPVPRPGMPKVDASVTVTLTV